MPVWTVIRSGRLAEFTGERVIPGEVDADLLNEHVARYLFAARMAGGRRVLDAGCGSGYGVAELARNLGRMSLAAFLTSRGSTAFGWSWIAPRTPSISARTSIAAERRAPGVISRRQCPSCARVSHAARVIGAFARDGHVVHVAFAQARRRHPQKAGLFLQVAYVRAPAVAHSSPQSANQLIHQIR